MKSLLPVLSRAYQDRSDLARTDQQRQTSAPAQRAEARPRAPEMLALPPPAAAAPQPRHDLRDVSPRRFAEITHELYMEGVLSWEEFRLVGSPSELHPQYDQTIGALTGEKAEPDRPRDMLAQWERRVDFERRHNPDTESTRLAERVLEILQWQAQPPLDVAV